MDSLRTAPRSHLSGRQWPHFAVWYALFSQQALVELRRIVVRDRAHVCDHVNNGHFVVFRAPGIPVVQGQLVLGQPRLHTTFGVMRHLSFVFYIDLVASQLNALGVLLPRAFSNALDWQSLSTKRRGAATLVWFARHLAIRVDTVFSADFA